MWRKLNALLNISLAINKINLIFFKMIKLVKPLSQFNLNKNKEDELITLGYIWNMKIILWIDFKKKRINIQYFTIFVILKQKT